MTFRYFSLLVLAAVVPAIAYMAFAGNLWQSPSSSAQSLDRSIIDLTATNFKVGQLVSVPLGFKNNQNRKITITAISASCSCTEVRTAAALPIKLGIGEEISFSAQVTPGPNDYLQSLGIAVQWNIEGFEEVQTYRYKVNYKCAHDWVVSSKKIDLGSLALGKSIRPLEIVLKRLEGSGINSLDIRTESSPDITVETLEFTEPASVAPLTSLNRESFAKLAALLPTPKEIGGYSKQITIRDNKSDHVEVIQISGVVVDSPDTLQDTLTKL